MNELEGRRLLQESKKDLLKQGIEDLVEYFVCWGLQEIEKEQDKSN